MHRRNLRVDIDFLAKSLEEAGSLSVGKQVQLLLSTKARRGDGEYGRLNQEAERHDSSGTHGHSLHEVTGRWKWGAHVDVDDARERDDGVCSKDRDATQTRGVKPK